MDDCATLELEALSGRVGSIFSIFAATHDD